MTIQPDQFLITAWKQQLDAGLRMVEALVEGATRMHELQLEAAAQAHADAVATQRSLAAARDLPGLVRLQAEWTNANLRKSAAYWRSMAEAAMQTNAELAKCLRGGGGTP